MRPKDTSSSSRHKNKELRRLEAYNKSRSGRSRTDENHHEIEEEVKDERHDGKDERGDASSSQRQSMSQSRSRSPSVPSTASSGKRRTRTSPNCQSLSTAFARTRVSLHGKQKTIRTEQECGGKNRRGAGSKGRESNNGVR